MQRCYVYVAKPTAAMMLPQTNLFSVKKICTNVYSRRALMDLTKLLPRPTQKSKHYVNKQRFPNKPSRCCNTGIKYEEILLFLPENNFEE